MPSLKLVAIAKDEAPYLAEWIFHHLYLGIHEIEIYLNGITDNSYRIVRQISNFSNRVNFVQSDELLELALKAKQSFQLVIYDHVIKNEQASRRFSHLMFLDIDEYLLPAKFGTTIHSLLKESEDADVVSFLWHSDLPSMQRPSFSPLLCRSIWMKKMCQIKSMCRLNGAAKRSKIHTFIIDKKKYGTAIFKLSDGSDPQLYNKRKLVSNSDLERLSGRFEPWFIYHRVFRSHHEYCASLVQGNLHRRNRQPIKKNRYGYCIQVNGKQLPRFHGDSIEYRINRWQLIAYQCSYYWFIRRARLKKLIKRGQKLKMDDYKQLKQLIDQHPELRQLYRKQLRSTQFEFK
jgi:hypothetical protein